MEEFESKVFVELRDNEKPCETTSLPQSTPRYKAMDTSSCWKEKKAKTADQSVYVSVSGKARSKPSNHEVHYFMITADATTPRFATLYNRYGCRTAEKQQGDWAEPAEHCALLQDPAPLVQKAVLRASSVRGLVLVVGLILVCCGGCGAMRHPDAKDVPFA